MDGELDNRAIGRRLKAARRARGLKQNAVATMMGIDPPRLQNWEAGRATMPPEFVLKFWQITGATFDYVYRGDLGSLPAALLDALKGRTADGPGEGAGAA